jgi:hypothetical protein
MCWLYVILGDSVAVRRPITCSNTCTCNLLSILKSKVHELIFLGIYLRWIVRRLWTLHQCARHNFQVFFSLLVHAKIRTGQATWRVRRFSVKTKDNGHASLDSCHISVPLPACLSPSFFLCYFGGGQYDFMFHDYDWATETWTSIYHDHSSTMGTTVGW